MSQTNVNLLRPVAAVHDAIDDDHHDPRYPDADRAWAQLYAAVVDESRDAKAA